MKQLINAAIAIFLFFCLQSQVYANQRGVDGLIIGGGAGAIVGQAIGRNAESTILGATVGGILGAVIASENSYRHHRPVIVHQRPTGPHGRYFNYTPRHQSPRFVYNPPHNHGKKHYKKVYGYKRDGCNRYSDRYRTHRPHYRPYNRR